MALKTTNVYVNVTLEDGSISKDLVGEVSIFTKNPGGISKPKFNIVSDDETIFMIYFAYTDFDTYHALFECYVDGETTNYYFNSNDVVFGCDIYLDPVDVGGDSKKWFFNK